MKNQQLTLVSFILLVVIAISSCNNSSSFSSRKYRKGQFIEHSRKTNDRFKKSNEEFQAGNYTSEEDSTFQIDDGKLVSEKSAIDISELSKKSFDDTLKKSRHQRKLAEHRAKKKKESDLNDSIRKILEKDEEFKNKSKSKQKIALRRYKKQHGLTNTIREKNIKKREERIKQDQAIIDELKKDSTYNLKSNSQKKIALQKRKREIRKMERENQSKDLKLARKLSFIALMLLILLLIIMGLSVFFAPITLVTLGALLIVAILVLCIVTLKKLSRVEKTAESKTRDFKTSTVRAVLTLIFTILLIFAFIGTSFLALY